MTNPFTIAERVARMHATMTADPPAEPMGAQGRVADGCRARCRAV